MIKTIFSSLLLFLMGTPVMAGDIYVAPTGSDTAPGTVSAPLLTPAAAIRMAREWRRLNRQETVGGIRIHLSGGDVCRNRCSCAPKTPAHRIHPL